MDTYSVIIVNNSNIAVSCLDQELTLQQATELRDASAARCLAGYSAVVVPEESWNIGQQYTP